MNYILGFIQGISEFLPISSTGHLNLAQYLFGFKPSLSFDIFLHLATLFSVLFFFRKFIKYFFDNLIYIIIASIPVAVIGFIFQDKIDNIFSDIKLLPIFFLITSIFVFSTKFFKNYKQKLNYKKALIIGLFQCIALLPGVSRSGTTIMAGLLVGLSPLEAFNFSFALFIPATIGAVILGLKDFSFTPNLIPVFILTFLVGLFALNILKKSLQSRNFWKFSIYTFILALALFIQF